MIDPILFLNAVAMAGQPNLRPKGTFKLPTNGLEPAPKKDKAKEKLRRQRKAKSRKKRGY